jgi:hypothetical protein
MDVILTLYSREASAASAAWFKRRFRTVVTASHRVVEGLSPPGEVWPSRAGALARHSKPPGVAGLFCWRGLCGTADAGGRGEAGFEGE